tara:strand:- start:15 stop:203 length:189 start_codon:yes stop_codon:yes gene_type:complete
MILNLIFLLGCMPKPVEIGVIDVREGNVCVVQLANESFVYLTSDFCRGLKEGDVIGVVNGSR